MAPERSNAVEHLLDTDVLGAAGKGLAMPERIRDLEAKLARAERHIVRGRGIVACQRERIAVLKRNGRPTKVAEETLAVFLTTLALFEDHERQLLDRADEAVRTFCETEPLWLDSAADPECSNPAQSATRAIVETVAGLSRLCPR